MAIRDSRAKHNDSGLECSTQSLMQQQVQRALAMNSTAWEANPGTLPKCKHQTSGVQATGLGGGKLLHANKMQASSHGTRSSQS